MSEWIIVSKSSRGRLGDRSFPTRDLAETWIARLGNVLAENYTPWCNHPVAKINHIINEGLVKNDLENLLLSRVSVDEYISADPHSLNAVFAIFVRGCPEAVNPLKSFLEHCNGVLQVDFGDSETIPDCSVLYIEFDRDNLAIGDINDMMTLLGMLSGIKPTDFTMTFPNTDKKYPYNPAILKKYFAMRTKQANAKAQKQAIVFRTKELQDELQKKVPKADQLDQNGIKQDQNQNSPDHVDVAQQEQEEDQQEQAQQNPASSGPVGESIINRLVGLIG